MSDQKEANTIYSVHPGSQLKSQQAWSTLLSSLDCGWNWRPAKLKKIYVFLSTSSLKQLKERVLTDAFEKEMWRISAFPQLIYGENTR